jgi:hypothetical protein
MEIIVSVKLFSNRDQFYKTRCDEEKENETTINNKTNFEVSINQIPFFS